MQKTIIKNAKIIDGQGKPAYDGTIIIQGNKIIDITGDKLAATDGTLDASGLVVAPGFIDIHSHTDLAHIYGNVDIKLKQGITTEIVGNCGFSAVPAIPEQKHEIKSFLLPIMGEDGAGEWVSVQAYLQAAASNLTLNLGTLIGHGTLRISAMGPRKGKPKKDELALMEDLLVEGLKEGAWGLSVGLIYAPGCYADYEELLALGRIAAYYNVPFVAHIRSEAGRIIESVTEILNLGAATGAHVHISHHQIDGRKNWGCAEITMSMIKRARTEGLRVTLDQYPYLAGSTMLLALLPKWVLQKGREGALQVLSDSKGKAEVLGQLMANGGDEEYLARETGWENIMLNNLPRHPDLEGKYLAELAQKENMDPAEILIKLILAEAGEGTVVLFDQCNDDWFRIFQDPFCSVASDSILVGTRLHPRSYGTFPRVLGRLTREKDLIPLEEAVRRMTSLPAATFGLRNIGSLEPGNYADLVIFDESRIGHTGSFREPGIVPTGIEYVFVSGHLALINGKPTNIKAGRVLKRNV